MQTICNFPKGLSYNSVCFCLATGMPGRELVITCMTVWHDICAVCDIYKGTELNVKILLNLWVKFGNTGKINYCSIFTGMAANGPKYVNIILTQYICMVFMYVRYLPCDCGNDVNDKRKFKLVTRHGSSLKYGNFIFNRGRDKPALQPVPIILQLWQRLKMQPKHLALIKH